MRALPYGLAVAAAAVATWMYVENRQLRADLAARPLPAAAGSASPDGSAGSAASAAAEGAAAPRLRATGIHLPGGAPPTLTVPAEESRLDRRARRQTELAALLGREPGETAEAYRARVAPLISAGLALPRVHAQEMREEAEAKAHVTPAQHAQLDHAFDKVYGDLLDYTNKAVADGQLSPYERNVAGMLDYAGGLGGLLSDANGQIGQILSPEQVQALSASGFEWAEYLGLSAPWEKLEPPPAR